MLQEEMWPLVSQQPDIDNLYFQQDGAPPHYCRNVRNWLDNKIPGHYIGRQGCVDWPARSPDLTPLDFFLWGVLKNAVYVQKPRSTADLKRCIKQEWRNISPDICKKACQSIVQRFRDCVLAEGHQFEHLY